MRLACVALLANAAMGFLPGAPMRSRTLSTPVARMQPRTSSPLSMVIAGPEETGMFTTSRYVSATRAGNPRRRGVTATGADSGL